MQQAPTPLAQAVLHTGRHHLSHLTGAFEAGRHQRGVVPVQASVLHRLAEGAIVAGKALEPGEDAHDGHQSPVAHLAVSLQVQANQVLAGRIAKGFKDR
ncbi:hypothetical protein TYRP_020012 [Tyrophagus putrescentiae]|nr:hypothetical protein TYRP_020012 [Tyrophagus putrescentiae]